VGYTDHLFGAIYRISKDLETPKYIRLKNDIDKVKIVVLDVGVQNNKNKKIKVAQYVDKFIALGYTQYYTSNLVRYTVHTDIISRGHLEFLVVYLKDKRCNKVIVGLFRERNEFQQFVNEYYPNKKCNGIYYAKNSYTENYLRDRVNKLSIV
jgi:hypothetical protein